MTKKILVADDEPHIVKLIDNRLRANGYEVITAINGEECLNKAMSEKPDLIILDIMMPKMNGYNTIIALRQIIENTGGMSKIPVIILTARAGSEVKELFDREEIEDYILKPFTTEDLIRKIKEIFKEG